MSTKKLTVDRLEGDLAVCECGDDMVDIPLSKIKGEVRSGDILTKNGSVYTVDRENSEKRRKEIIALQNSLWDDN